MQHPDASHLRYSNSLDSRVRSGEKYLETYRRNHRPTNKRLRTPIGTNSPQTFLFYSYELVPMGISIPKVSKFEISNA